MWSARQSRKMGRRVAGLLGGLLVGLLLVAAPAAAASVVEGPINVSTSASHDSAAIRSEFPAIAVNGAGVDTRVFVAWKEGNEIYFRRSLPPQGSCGGGLKFEEPMRLWDGGAVAPSGPALAANNRDGVFVAWQAGSAVWFRRSTNDGRSFDDPVIPLGANSGASNAPSVGADNAAGVFVAWSNSGEIFFAGSTSAGAADSFPLAANVVSGSASVTSRGPSVATDGTSVFVAWEEGSFPNPIRLLLRKFGRQDDPMGAGSVLVDLLSGSGLAGGSNPHLAFGNDVLSVAFVSSGAVYHRLSRDRGATFSLPAQQLSGPGLPQINARAARGNDSALNDSAMVAWAQRPVGSTLNDTEIQYSLPGPTAAPEMVSATLGAKSVNPAAAIDSTGRLLWAWQETVNLIDEIYVSYKEGTSGGTEMKAEVWSAPRHVNPQTMGPGTMRRPNLTVFIEPSDGQNWSVYDIYPGSVRLNGEEALGPTAIGDSNGNGKPDMMVKFDRGDLGAVAPGELEYPVTGDTKLPDGSHGCPFRGNGKVQIMQ